MAIIDNTEQTLDALLRLMDVTQHRFCLYTPQLNPALFAHSDLLARLRSLALRPRLSVRLLLPPAAEWRRPCAELFQLCSRLSSRLDNRVLPAQEPRERSEFSLLMALADQRHLLRLVNPQRMQGSLHLDEPGQSRPLQNFFDEIWEKGLEEAELRQLGI